MEKLIIDEVEVEEGYTDASGTCALIQAFELAPYIGQKGTLIFIPDA